MTEKRGGRGRSVLWLARKKEVVRRFSGQGADDGCERDQLSYRGKGGLL